MSVSSVDSQIPENIHERYRYLIDNNKVCLCCKKNKRLSLYQLDDLVSIRDNCKTCEKRIAKKQLEKETMKQVLSILTKSNIEL
jgi:hypothetical protein